MENLITEGRYDQVTTELSREIVQAIKKGVKRYTTRIVLFSRTFIDIVANIKYDDDQDIDVSGGAYLNPKQVRSYFKNKRISFHIIVPKTESLMYQNLTDVIIPELKSTIRHEIEHIAQFRFKDRQRKNFFSSGRGYPQDITYEEYLSEPYEVEAFVRGMYKKAKTIGVPLNVILNDFWDYLESADLSDQDIEKLKKLYTDYAKKHLYYDPQRKLGFVWDTNDGENRVNEEIIGFRPSYLKPEINVIVNFEVHESKENLKLIIKDILEKNKITVNSITGGGKSNNYRLDLNLYNEREVSNLVDDLHRILMVNDIRIHNVTTQIK